MEGRGDGSLFCAWLLLRDLTTLRYATCACFSAQRHCGHSLLSEVGEVQRSKQTDKYVRRRQRQNVTVGGQPATPLQAVGAEVLVVEVLSHFLEVLHVGSDERRAGSHGYVS